jgi:hypothetical protein
MQQSLAAMQTALRVLTALSEKRDPDPADIDALVGYAPLLENLSVDELACDVIQQALKRRAEARTRRVVTGD